MPWNIYQEPFDIRHYRLLYGFSSLPRYSPFLSYESKFHTNDCRLDPKLQEIFIHEINSDKRFDQSPDQNKKST